MATISSEQPTQAFRFHPTNEIARIPAVVDADSRQRIVFWSAIKDVFRDSNLVMNGEVIVPFLEDEGFTQIIPLRIAYHPGVVLEVFEETMGTGSSSHNSSTQPIDVKQNPVIQMHLNNAHAILRQTYELYKHPLPRLFIVLPKTRQFSEKPLADDFRLYFLCECGTHTLPENCSTPHEIHLAKHEGYELEEPTKFFEEYGTYLLAMMYMVKCGINAAGMIVPVLAKLDIADDVVENLKDTDHLRKHAKLLVDATIDYLHELENDIEPGTGLSEYHADSDSLEALKGADLRQLESYLKIKDQGCVLGNLYRIVTQDGHVKWVCIDHYRTISKETAIQELRDIVATNRGVFVEGTGKVVIKIARDILANQFYDALIKAQRVQELEITLEWGATMDACQALANAVTRSGVIFLVVNGIGPGRSPIDFVNRSRKFDPIAQLAFNGRVQSLRVKEFDKFFSHVTNPALAFTSKLRELSIDSFISFDGTAFRSYSGFLDHSPSLRKLELKFEKQYPITSTIEDILGKLRKLESLKFYNGNLLFTARVSKGNLQDKSLTIERLGYLGTEDVMFIQQGDLLQLAIECAPQEADENQLRDIIRHNPKLATIRIGCIERRCRSVVNLVISTREALLQEGGACHLRTFELMDERLLPFDEATHFNETTIIHSVVSFTEDSAVFSMRTWIRSPYRKPIAEDDPICDFVREYGWSIVCLRGTSSDYFVGIIDDSTSKNGSQLEQIEFNPYRLSETGLAHLDKVIERSPNLSGLLVLLHNAHLPARIQRTQSLLGRYGKRLSGLSLLGHYTEPWLPDIVSSFPASHFENLRTEFSISFTRRPLIKHMCILWIVDMISAWPQELGSAQPSNPRDIVVGQSNPGIHGSSSTTPRIGLKQLAIIRLEHFYLSRDEWRMVIEAVDYSKLQMLSFSGSGFGEEQMRLLIDCIPDRTTKAAVPLTLNIRDTYVSLRTASQVLEAMISRLREKVPSIEVKM